MRNRISIAMSGLGLICAFLTAPIASAQHNAPPGGPAQQNGGTGYDAPVTYYYFCINSEVKANAPTYISPVVQRSVGVRALNVGAVEEDLKKTFGGFLAQKYGYAGTISCTNQPSKSWMEGYRKDRIDLLRSRGYQVVEADWTDTGATSTPMPPSNPAAAAQPATAGEVAGKPPTPYVVCWAQLGGYTPYVSAAFDAAKSDGNAWVPAFIGYLKQKYGYKGFASCDKLNSLAEAQSHLKRTVDNFRSVTFNNGSHQEVIETGWTYTAAANDVISQPAGATFAPGTSGFYCLTPSSAQHVIYFSAIAPKNAGVTQGDRESSFAAFLQTKYGYRTSTSCPDTNFTTPQAAKDYVTGRQVQIANYRSGGYTVVETDWTYGSSAAAPAASAAPVAPARVAPPQPATPARTAATPRVITHPAAAPASSVPQTHYGICYGSPAGLPPTAYFSDPFEAPVPDVQAWSNTYRQVLRNQYKFMPNVHCSALKSLADVQKMKDRMRVHWKIVETGWKNQ